jgi:hypothetical protein
VTALISRLIGEPLSGSAQLLVAAVVLGSAAFALRAIAQREADPPLSVTAGIVCTAVLLSLYHQPHDMPFLALPFAAVVMHRLPEALSRPGVRWTLLTLYALVAANYFSSWGVLDRLGFLDDARALSREPGAILLGSLNGLGLLAIFSIYVVVVVWRQQGGRLVPRPRAGVRNRSYSG